MLACAAACALAASGGSAATPKAGAGVFTGFGFETCTAPSTTALSAWTASPYRALGIYLGGINRACADGNLSATWVATTLGSGWSVMPLYVGLQAPCVSATKLKLISTNLGTASAQGSAAADDAIARAAFFGLPAGSPLYFDMEGYSTTNASCSKVVQTFVTAWVDELHGRGYAAGVYGSAASTIRDIAALGTSIPDDAWIANWNGIASVFGDPYVSDSLWANHQRIHQYKGGHKETYAGVTLTIDSDYVDGAVVGGTAPPQPPAPAPAGSVGSGDGKATATWPSGAFTGAVVVTLTPVAPPPAPAVYAVRLTVTQPDGTTPVTTFGAGLTLHLAAQGAGVVPALSADGVTWTPVHRLASAVLPAGASFGYTVEPDGSFDVLTLVPGVVSLVPDTTPPSQPVVSGRFSHGSLVLTWQAASDDSGSIASYRVLLDGGSLLTRPGNAHAASVHSFHPDAKTVYRVQALDAAGNAGKPSRPLVVVPTQRPSGLPRPLPRWAWQLFTWQHGGGARPATAPKKPPAWYWRWSAWRLAPFHLARR